MNDKEAMAMALEALKFALHVGFDESSESQMRKGDKAGQQHRQAITLLKERLVDPMREVQRLGQEIEQEPAQRKPFTESMIKAGLTELKAIRQTELVGDYELIKRLLEAAHGIKETEK